MNLLIDKFLSSAVTLSILHEQRDRKGADLCRSKPSRSPFVHPTKSNGSQKNNRPRPRSVCLFVCGDKSDLTGNITAIHWENVLLAIRVVYPSLRKSEGLICRHLMTFLQSLGEHQRQESTDRVAHYYPLLLGGPRLLADEIGQHLLPQLQRKLCARCLP